MLAELDYGSKIHLSNNYSNYYQADATTEAGIKQFVTPRMRAHAHTPPPYPGTHALALAITK